MIQRPIQLSRRWLALWLLLPLSTAAHDFWLQPERFTIAPGSKIRVDMVVGHDGEVDPWALQWERVVSWRSFGPHGVQDQQSGLVPSSARVRGGAVVRLVEEGTHILALESHHAFSELPAEKFNEYLALEGLTLAQQTRQAHGTGDQPGRELYSRRAKALIQVGARQSDQALKPIGQSLEIVPEAHPGGVHGEQARLAFRIYFHGQPLPGALVDLSPVQRSTHASSQHQDSHRHAHATSVTSQPAQRSDAQGRVVFQLPYPGPWRVNVIWSRPLSDHAKADFETVFSSLTFAN